MDTRSLCEFSRTHRGALVRYTQAPLPISSCSNCLSVSIGLGTCSTSAIITLFFTVYKEACGESVNSAIQVQRLVRGAYLTVALVVLIDAVNAVIGATVWHELIEAKIISAIYVLYITTVLVVFAVYSNKLLLLLSTKARSSPLPSCHENKSSGPTIGGNRDQKFQAFARRVRVIAFANSGFVMSLIVFAVLSSRHENYWIITFLVVHCIRLVVGAVQIRAVVVPYQQSPTRVKPVSVCANVLHGHQASAVPSALKN